MANSLPIWGRKSLIPTLCNYPIKAYSADLSLSLSFSRLLCLLAPLTPTKTDRYSLSSVTEKKKKNISPHEHQVVFSFTFNQYENSLHHSWRVNGAPHSDNCRIPLSCLCYILCYLGDTTHRSQHNLELNQHHSETRCSRTPPCTLQCISKRWFLGGYHVDQVFSEARWNQAQ